MSASSANNLHYSAPETLSFKFKYTSNADVYGFGMLLWELAALTAPFSNMDDNAIRNEIKKCSPLPFPEETPEVIQRLVEDCRKVNPTDRPPMSEVLKRLEQARTNVSKEELSEEIAYLTGTKTGIDPDVVRAVRTALTTYVDDEAVVVAALELLDSAIRHPRDQADGVIIFGLLSQPLEEKKEEKKDEEKKEGTPIFVNAFKKYIKSQKVCDFALTVLNHVTMSLASAKDKEWILVHCMDDIFAAMTEHLASLHLQESACALLGVLSTKPFSHAKLMKDGLKVIVAAMSAHKDQSRLQEKAAGCICNLAYNLEHREAIKQSGVLTLLEELKDQTHNIKAAIAVIKKEK